MYDKLYAADIDVYGSLAEVFDNDFELINIMSGVNTFIEIDDDFLFWSFI